MFCLYIFVISTFSAICPPAKGQEMLLTLPKEAVAAPNILRREFSCGYVYFLGKFSANIGDETVPIYYLNATAAQLSSEGFEITVGHMFDDAIYNFTYTNGTFFGGLGFDSVQAISSTSGGGGTILNPRIRAYNMALLGKKRGDDIHWLCDGVLISLQWVLSAAHCFTEKNTEPNIVRLGEYDLSEPVETDPSVHGKNINDYSIAKVLYHPMYKVGERYHDLALIQLPRRYPEFTQYINPICLPWDSETNKNLVGTQAVLNGWGRNFLQDGAVKSTRLQEARLEILDPDICNADYSHLEDFRKMFPNGVSSANTLCVGFEKGGETSCIGDSGSPLSYQNEGRDVILAGIFSVGNECRTNKLPGIYIPINRPEYLQWIKDTAFQENSQQLAIPTPNITHNDFNCGYIYPLGIYWGTIAGENYYQYYLNTTVDRLSSEGFNVTVGRMFGDAIYNFTYTNGTFSGKMSFDGVAAIAPAGGEPAAEIRGYYMAQLGERRKNEIIWLCDGVLINREWVLSAAHCFLRPGAEPNIIRLGDYDLSKPVETGTNPSGKFVYDYPINDVIFHPQFQDDERYYDLVLIQLPRKYPEFSSSINPICLPWDSETNRNHVGKQVVLTGWGALHYGGDKTNLLQEVNVTVFSTSVCNESYSQLPRFSTKYPQGMTFADTLCAGWEEGGKDACGGDSGAPIAYQREDESITLAGIVSGGYGCGHKEYPGLYIPINNPEILKWIKDTAFQEYL